MNLMTRSEHFASGMDVVDVQHKALVEMINSAGPHLASGGEDAQGAAGPLPDKRVRHAASHFRYEEDWMQQAGVLPAYFAQHKQTHQTFVDEVIQMRTQHETGKSLGGNDLPHFLTSWLTFHILSEDKHMAVQVLAIRDTAAQAFDALDTSKGAPQAVYNAALVKLFSLLTARNRTLPDANAQVRDAQRAVEASNSLLETRVQECTCGLADANRALEGERQALEECIASLQQTQARLLQSEKRAAVGQLAAGVAHEINNPIGFVSSNLASLSGHVEHMLTLLAAYEKTRLLMPAALRSGIESLPAHAELEYIRQDAPELVRECKEGLARVKRIVNDLRDFSRVDTADWASADIHAVLDSALQVVRNELKYKAEVVKEYVSLPSIACNAVQLGQVFVNLQVNAAQAIESHGTIRLRTGSTQAGIWNEVRDTGVGMSTETQNRIFEPFYTTKPVGQGTGPGLSISWDIVKQHSGALEAQSSPGLGACFRVPLPVARVQAPAGPSA